LFFFFVKLCKQLGSIDAKLENELEFLKRALEANKPIAFVASAVVSSNKMKKSVKFRDQNSNRGMNGDEDDTENEEDADMIENDEAMAEVQLADGSVVKRPINKVIEKNRGLTPNRPKMYRNPRVRNRFKARKANIKHKSIVPKVRSQEKRYTGEGTGIRSNVIRAHKIK
jgi:hypothetical protein